MRFSTLVAPLAISLAGTTAVRAGPKAYGVCQTDCNKAAVSCYTAAGFTFGTVVTDAETPAVILGCNNALGTCSATCANVTLSAPTP